MQDAESVSLEPTSVKSPAIKPVACMSAFLVSFVGGYDRRSYLITIS